MMLEMERPSITFMIQDLQKGQARKSHDKQGEKGDARRKRYK